MTALTQMAAARPPGIADARVPCPLCGGLIHPVAGRCKHCKEDLTSFRAGRPQAAAALPALSSGPIIAKPTNGSNGHVVAAPIPVVVATAQDASIPILPPRTTARSVKAARPPSMWKSWPMLVIVLAVVAIVGAIVIMLLPPNKQHADGKMSAPPAPERMQTNPIEPGGKQGQLAPTDPSDPWGKADPGAPAAPLAPPQPAAPDPDDDDIWGGTQGGLGGGTLGGSFGAKGPFMITVLDRACKKLKSCADVDQSALKILCDQVDMMPKPPMPTCAPAKKCLEAIDDLSCSRAATTSPMSMFTLFDACAEAENC